MTARIFRYEVPVDDNVATLRLMGDPLAVGCRHFATLEFWAQVDDGPTVARSRSFLVVGTGQPLLANTVRHWGTAVAPGGQLVWHLIEVS